MLYTVWWDVCQQLLMPHTLTITHTITKTHLEILPSLLCRCVASESSVFFLFVSPISFCLAYSLSASGFFSHLLPFAFKSFASPTSPQPRRSRRPSTKCAIHANLQSPQNDTSIHPVKHQSCHSHSQRKSLQTLESLLSYFTFRVSSLWRWHTTTRIFLAAI